MLTIQQVARRLGISETLVRKYVREGRLGQTERFGARSHAISERQLKALIKSRETPPATGRRPKELPAE